MPFIRVKSARRGDPQHEFDVTVGEAERNSGLYQVVDPTPVDTARSATYVSEHAAPRTDDAPHAASTTKRRK